MLLSELLKGLKDSRYMETNDCGVLDAELKPGQRWITINSKEGGKARRILLGPKGEIIGGDVPKEEQGKKINKDPEKHIPKEKKEEKHIPEKKAEVKKEVPKEKKAEKKVEEKKKEEEKPKKPIHEMSGKEIREAFVEKHNEVHKGIEEINRQIPEMMRLTDKILEEAKMKYGKDFQYELLKNDPEYQTAFKKIDELAVKRTELTRESKKIFANMMTKPSENRMKIEIFSSSASGSVKWADEPINSVAALFTRETLIPGPGTNFVGSRRVQLHIADPSIRAHCQGQTIFMGKKSTPVLAHEFGHVIEHGNDRIHKACVDFRRRRTDGEQLKRLNSISGFSSYEDNELSRPDKFANPYVGKDYGDNAKSTEVFSMGLELIMKNPAEFAKKDPEHFELIVDIMNGKYSQEG